MDKRVFAVSAINRYIKSILDDDVVLNNIYVEGEITNFKAHPTGHLYFSLKDAYSQLTCVMFRTSAFSLGFMPENGMTAVAFGRVSAYEKTGQYQLYVERMDPAGIGALYLKLEKLKRKLSEEGLFEASRKRPLPPYPKTVAVITSGSGAAVMDIINIMTRRNAAIKIVVLPTAVQGGGAPEEIISSLEKVNEWGKADCVILGRGGGSMEDLGAFNDEGVARAVAASTVPVISAVGHETDFTITDLAADFRAPTPSAAAEIASPLLYDMISAVRSMYVRLNRGVAVRMTAAKQAANNRALAPPSKIFTGRRERLSSAAAKLNGAVASRLDVSRMESDRRYMMLESLSHMKILKRGYAYIRSGGETVGGAGSLFNGQKITAVFHDGTADAVVTALNLNETACSGG